MLNMYINLTLDPGDGRCVLEAIFLISSHPLERLSCAPRSVSASLLQAKHSGSLH